MEPTELSNARLALSRAMEVATSMRKDDSRYPLIVYALNILWQSLHEVEQNSARTAVAATFH